MSNKRSSFGKRVFGNTAYALIDLILYKISTTVVFIILVRLLPDVDIAAIGISMGYLVFVSYLDVAPIRVLLRDYSKISGDHSKRNELLTALFSFWILQSLFMLILCFALQVLFLNGLNAPDLGFLFFAMTLDFIALSFWGWVKTIYYTDFRQGVATKISLILTVARITSYGVLFLAPSLVAYSWLLIITAVLACCTWGIAFTLHFDYRPKFSRNTPTLLMDSLKDYGLWDHFNRMVVNTLFVIDAVILSATGHLRDIGSYTIALKFVSLLTLIPSQLSHALQVVLSNYDTNTQRFDAINTFLKVNGLVSILQLAVIVLFGEWLLQLLFGVDINPDVLRFSIIIAVGVTLFNLGFPFMSILNTFCSIREGFLSVFLPVLVIGTGVYIGTAMEWGAIGIAYGNIVTYLVLALGLILFITAKYPFPLRLKLLSKREKDLAHELFRTFGRIK